MNDDAPLIALAADLEREADRVEDEAQMHALRVVAARWRELAQEGQA